MSNKLPGDADAYPQTTPGSLKDLEVSVDRKKVTCPPLRHSNTRSWKDAKQLAKETEKENEVCYFGS